MKDRILLFFDLASESFLFTLKDRLLWKRRRLDRQKEFLMGVENFVGEFSQISASSANGLYMTSVRNWMCFRRIALFISLTETLTRITAKILVDIH